MSNIPRHFYDFGSFRVDAAERVLLRDGKPVPLAPKVFDMLLVLVENSGHVLEKDELLKKVWRDSFVEEANLSNNVFLLRKALGEDKNGRKYIETVPRRGYRFVADVTELGDDGAQERVLEEHTRARIVIEEESDESAAAPHHIDAEPLGATRAISLPAPRASTSRRRTFGVALASLVLLAVLAAGALWLRPARTDSKAALPPESAKSSSMRVMPLTTTPGDEWDPALSPDGTLLAYAGRETHGGSINIFVKQIDASGTPLRLSAAPELEAGSHALPIRDGGPTWSPDARYIAYVRASRIKEECGVFVVPTLGGVARMLFPTKDYLCGAGVDWSPDGKSMIAVLRSSLQEPFAIYLLPLDTLELKRLTSPPAGYYGDTRAAISPDGRSVAFNRGSSLYGDSSEMYVVPVAGGEARQLTFDHRRTMGAAWTPDSKWVVFASNRGGNYSLWKVPAEGGAVEPVAAGVENAYDPSASREGSRIAYTHLVRDTNVWRLDLKAHGAATPTRLITSTRKDDNPSLSPDGKRIVFESDRTGSQQLWLCDADGANAFQLTTLGGPIPASNPRWSPDGRLIVFESRPEAMADLYVVSPDSGAPPRRLTDDPHNEVAPSWSVDGRFLYFASDRSGDWEVWKMPAEGGAAARVTSHGGFEAHESPDGQFLYYNKYGWNTRGLFRVPVGGGEETLVLDIAQREAFGLWVATNEGVYFIDREQFAHFGLEYFDFATRRTKELATLTQDPSDDNPGLNVSPDGRSFVLSMLESNSHDIMLIENLPPALR